MLSGISWSSYLSFIAILTAAWYVIVITVYFRKDLLVFGRRLATQPLPVAATAPTPPDSIIYDLLEELKPVFASQPDKPALLTAIRGRLSKYPGLHHSPLRTAINDHIIQQSAAVGLAISTDDLYPLWAP